MNWWEIGIRIATDKPCVETHIQRRKASVEVVVHIGKRLVEPIAHLFALQSATGSENGKLRHGLKAMEIANAVFA